MNVLCVETEAATMGMEVLYFTSLAYCQRDPGVMKRKNGHVGHRTELNGMLEKECSFA